MPDQRRPRSRRRATTRVAARLARDIPGAFKPDQYWNVENPAAHERTTGPELWDQTDGRITHFVASVGTGGTISGAAHYLKAQQPGDPGHRRGPGGQRAVGRHRPAVPDRGRRRGLLPGHLRPVGRSTAGSASATATRSRWPAGSPARRGSCPAARAGRRWSRRARSSATWPRPTAGTRRWSSCCSPTAAGTTCPSSTTTSGCASTACSPTTGAATRVDDAARRPPPRDRPAGRRRRAHDRAGRRRDRDAPGYGISQLPVSERADGDDVEGLVGSISEKGLLDRAYRDPIGRRADRRRGDGPAAAAGRGVARRSTRRSRCCQRRGRALVAVRGGRPAGVVTKLDLLEYLAHHRTRRAGQLAGDGARVPGDRDSGVHS